MDPDEVAIAQCVGRKDVDLLLGSTTRAPWRRTRPVETAHDEILFAQGGLESLAGVHLVPAHLALHVGRALAVEQQVEGAGWLSGPSRCQVDTVRIAARP